MELAQIEAEDKERKILEEIETLKTPVDGGSRSVIMKGSYSAGMIMESNSSGKTDTVYSNRKFL